MSFDHERFIREVVDRKPADAIFSVAQLQKEIDKKRRPDRRPFTIEDLKRFSSLANRLLAANDEDNPYTGEVFVDMGKGDYIYDMEGDRPEEVEYTGLLYGYVNTFMVTVPKGADEEVFAVEFERYSDTFSDKTHSYLLPLAVKGTNYGVRIIDAPAPVGESSVEVSTQRMHNIDQEDTEQDTIHSLLDIIESNLFEENAVRTNTFEDTVGSLQSAGFIKDLGDMTTACNYYFQLCFHADDPWKVVPDTIMERFDDHEGFDESGIRKRTLEWVSQELIVVGVDLEQKPGKSVRCIVYARSEDGVLYRSSNRDDEEFMTLFREDESGNAEEDEEGQDSSGEY